MRHTYKLPKHWPFCVWNRFSMDYNWHGRSKTWGQIVWSITKVWLITEANRRLITMNRAICKNSLLCLVPHSSYTIDNYLLNLYWHYITLYSQHLSKFNWKQPTTSATTSNNAATDRPLSTANASISSKKIIAGAAARALRNNSRTAFSDSPTHLDSSSGPWHNDAE